MLELNTYDRSKLIKAIYDAGRTVTVGDVIKRTALPEATISLALLNFASESKAHILVDQAGNVAYKFKVGFERMSNRSLTRIPGVIWAAVTSACVFLMKTAFGLAMILSAWSFALPLIIFAIVKALYDFVQLQDHPDERWSLLDIRNWPNIFRSAMRTQILHAGKVLPSNIFFDCYSFVFGDGDPNYDLEDRKWEMIAQLIERNDGVITCEQLGPFIGRQSTDDDMIPVMVRFNGVPEVTDTGHLVYVFRQMTVSGISNVQNTKIQANDDPDFLEERYWKLTGISLASKVLIAVVLTLSGASIFAVLICLLHAKTIGILLVVPIILFFEQYLGWLLYTLVFIFHIVGIWGILVGTLALLVLAPCWFIQSVFFFLYPLGRFCVLQFKNISIYRRNACYRQLAIDLQEVPTELKIKLEEARSRLPTQIKVEEHHLAFDSSKDCVEQQFESKQDP